jgi:O-antigen ligase
LRWYNVAGLSSGSATLLQVAARSRAISIARVGWQGLLPLLVPCGLLIAGGAIGYTFTLDARVAGERLLGLILASLLAAVAVALLKGVERTAPLLIAAAVSTLVGGLWVIAATGPDVFRGPVGALLQLLFRPIFGLVQVTDPIEITNTRFIVGYNGLADLCAVAIFCCAAILIDRPQPRTTRPLIAMAAGSLVLLVGTGARGGLTGLAAGICAVGLFMWPKRYAFLAVVAAPFALAVAVFAILDKGLEFSSTAGRLTYWGDLARLLAEYPLTGVGLGLDTAFRISLLYEVNPDPERVFYAHNTFVQSYLEQGPLGALGMLGVPLVALAAALIARRFGASRERRPLLIAGLGIVGALTAHGLTDQVVTTNVGTGLLLLGLAAILAALSSASTAVLGRGVQKATLALGAAAAIALVIFIATPRGRAQVLLDFGGLQLNQALQPQSVTRAASVASSESTLVLALTQDPAHPAVLRELARARSARFDDAGALDALKRVAGSPELDAFDMLQIGHLYRDLGFADEAYAWAARAYAAWGRAPEDAVMQAYAQSTLHDSRAQNLADQAEAAMRARTFSVARTLFEQALTFEPSNAYLQDRIGAAQRAVDKYGT